MDPTKGQRWDIKKPDQSIRRNVQEDLHSLAKGDFVPCIPVIFHSIIPASYLNMDTSHALVVLNRFLEFTLISNSFDSPLKCSFFAIFPYLKTSAFKVQRYLYSPSLPKLTFLFPLMSLFQFELIFLFSS